MSSAYAELYGRVERKLFAAVAAGRSAAALKSEYLQRHGIPARMFNGLCVSLEGQVASVKEQQKRQLDSLVRWMARACWCGCTVGVAASCFFAPFFGDVGACTV